MGEQERLEVRVSVKAVRDDDQSGKKPDGGRLGAIQDLMSLWSACLDSKHPNGTTTDRKKQHNNRPTT